MRPFAKAVAQSISLLGPLMASEWGIAAWLGGKTAPDGTVSVYLLGPFGLHGPQKEVEFFIKLVLGLVGILFLLLIDVADVYLPRRDLRMFRRNYLDEKAVEWRDKLGPDIRVNIMFAKWAWYFPFGRVFEWTWNSGFDPPMHKDANMWMCTWQGVCGKAYCTQEPQRAFFDGSATLSKSERYAFQNEFRMGHWQINRTSHVKGILSVPIMVSSAGMSPTHKCVGVINLDSATTTGTEEIRLNATPLAEYFYRHGKILGSLRT